MPLQGTVRVEPTRVLLGFADEEFGFATDLGFPTPDVPPSAFDLDPDIKREVIWHGPTLGRSNVLVDRHRSTVRVRDDKQWRVLTTTLSPFDSIFAEMADAQLTPEVVKLRDTVRRWRCVADHQRGRGNEHRRAARARAPVVALAEALSYQPPS